MSSLSSQPGHLCFPQLRCCSSQGLGDFVPFLPVCDLLLPPPSSFCSRARQHRRQHHFPGIAVPSQLAGAPVLGFQHRAAQLNRAQQLRLSRAQVWHRTFVKLGTSGDAPKFLPGHSIPISARVCPGQHHSVCCTPCSRFH